MATRNARTRSGRAPRRALRHGLLSAGALALLLALPCTAVAWPGRAGSPFGPGSPVPDVPLFPPASLNDRLEACLPERLHPISRQFLDSWLAGDIGTRTFRRFFHMPNSNYLPVGECLVRERLRMLADARRFSPI